MATGPLPYVNSPTTAREDYDMSEDAMQNLGRWPQDIPAIDSDENGHYKVRALTVRGRNTRRYTRLGRFWREGGTAVYLLASKLTGQGKIMGGWFD